MTDLDLLGGVLILTCATFSIIFYRMDRRIEWLRKELLAKHNEVQSWKRAAQLKQRYGIGGV